MTRLSWLVEKKIRGENQNFVFTFHSKTFNLSVVECPIERYVGPGYLARGVIAPRAQHHESDFPFPFFIGLYVELQPRREMVSMSLPNCVPLNSFSDAVYDPIISSVVSPSTMVGASVTRAHGDIESFNVTMIQWSLDSTTTFDQWGQSTIVNASAMIFQQVVLLAPTKPCLILVNSDGYGFAPSPAWLITVRLPSRISQPVVVVDSFYGDFSRDLSFFVTDEFVYWVEKIRDDNLVIHRMPLMC